MAKYTVLVEETMTVEAENESDALNKCLSAFTDKVKSDIKEFGEPTQFIIFEEN